MPAPATLVDLDCRHCGYAWASRARNGGDTRCPGCGVRRRVPSAAERYPEDGPPQAPQPPALATPALGHRTPAPAATTPGQHPPSWRAPAPAPTARRPSWRAPASSSTPRARRPPPVHRVHGWAAAQPVTGRCAFARWAGDNRWHWCELFAETTVEGWPACLGHAYSVERNRGLYGGTAIPPAGVPIAPMPLAG